MVDTLIFIHGWGSFPEIWSRQKEYFSSRYEVILPAIGAAKDIKEASNIVAESIGVRNNYCLVGWSLGWLVVLELLKSFGLNPMGIAGVSSTAKFADESYPNNGPTKTHLAKMIRDCQRDPKKAFESFYLTILADSGKEIFSGINLPHFDYHNLIYGLLILKQADYREFLKNINTPAFIISGEHDTICPKEASQYMRENIRDARLKILESGHMPFLSKTDEFNKALEDFIKEL